MTESYKACPNCDKPMDDRVEEEQRTGTQGDLSTGECTTYRVWACVNPDCVLFKTDIYKEILIDK